MNFFNLGALREGEQFHKQSRNCLCCDQLDQLQSPLTPHLENNRKTVGKGAEWAGQSAGETAEKQPDSQPNSTKTTVLHASGVFPAAFRLFASALPGAFSAHFSAVFEVRRSGPLYPKGPKIEKIQSRLKFSISLENFNLD